MSASRQCKDTEGVSRLDILVILATIIAVAAMLIPWLVNIRDKNARDNIIQHIREGNLRNVSLAVERDAVGDTYIDVDMTITEEWTKPDGTPSNMGYSLLCYAIRWDHPEVVELLIERGANVDGKVWRNDRQPIFWAAYNGNQKIFDTLIRAGADIQAVVQNKTALQHTEEGYEEAAAFLKDNDPEGS